MPSSNKIALKHCQNQFRWDRWNCPSSDFLIKKNSKYFDRETVFVQSLALASLTFSIMRNCSRNNFEGCQCSVRFDNSNLNNEIPNCFDALDDLVDRITGSIDQSAISRLDAYEYARIHNIRAVRIVSVFHSSLVYCIHVYGKLIFFFFQFCLGIENFTSSQLSLH